MERSSLSLVTGLSKDISETLHLDSTSALSLFYHHTPGCVTSRQYRLHLALVAVLIEEVLCKRNDGFLYVTSPRQHVDESLKQRHRRYCFLLYSQDFDTVYLVFSVVVWSVCDRSRCIALPCP